MNSKKLAAYSGVSVVLVVVLAYGLLQVSKLRSFQFFGELIDRVETEEKVVALTFDDAPTAYTEEVLAILKEKDVKATFYVIGGNVDKYPGELESILEMGHELGNHSYSHPRFLLKSQAFIKKEVETTNAILREAGYEGEITFRPPNGKKLFGLPWYLAQNDIKTVMWDVEPDTYFPGDADAITKYAVETVRPGSIILLHPFCQEACAADREALSETIDLLQSEGYTFLTISELLEY